MRAIGVGDDQAGVSRENLAGQILREGEEQPVAIARGTLPFSAARRSSTEDLISTIQISPRSFSATRSARRPEAAGNSLMQGKIPASAAPRRAARDRERGLGLTAVRRG